MSKSRTMSLNPLFDLTANAVRLSLEAGEVIGLRLMKASLGGARSTDEAMLMVTEKAQAAIDAQFLIARSVLAGDAHLAPARAVALYRRRVQANRRRLTRRS